VHIPVILDDDSWTRVTMCASSWFGCLWSQMMNVVGKVRHESEGECCDFLQFGVYLIICSFLLS